ncbi:hypothetical protein WN51_00605 [Melipona quadrifasciata]|uniref:Uncharacterized protein n=1 Tax=Melipona quadrifasciata TaxID=166423 RepID=A0A0M8ZZY2_9HYME|nr:hypothetical protein WN51_00605 [Melipona quadrifasciata]
MKTNSGQHGGCALQSRCKGISRMSGNWGDATPPVEQGPTADHRQVYRDGKKGSVTGKASSVREEPAQAKAFSPL